MKKLKTNQHGHRRSPSLPLVCQRLVLWGAPVPEAGGWRAAVCGVRLRGFDDLAVLGVTGVVFTRLLGIAIPEALSGDRGTDSSRHSCQIEFFATMPRRRNTRKR